MRPATNSSQTQISNRNEKDAQRYWEPDTPNIKPRWFWETCFVAKTKWFWETYFVAKPCFCGEPLVKLQNTKVFLN